MQDEEGEGERVEASPEPAPAAPPRKKRPKRKHAETSLDDGTGAKNAADGRKKARHNMHARRLSGAHMSEAQQSVNEQMRRVLEEDQYSALGSIVDTDSDEEETYHYNQRPVRLDRASLLQAARKFAMLENKKNQVKRKTEKTTAQDEDEEEGDHLSVQDTMQVEPDSGTKDRGPTNKPNETLTFPVVNVAAAAPSSDKNATDPLECLEIPGAEDDLDRDGGSIFGQTTGSSNSTWVECDKCKKWRRLRGVVDEKKLPPKWYCSMNKNDPERARCSAPEEEYESVHTPESAADARTRKHLRVWVRRLQCQEHYEARQPTQTRGKKRAAFSGNKEPYEWVRCCNPSCGKWRALLRIMDSSTNVIERTRDGEWYCVMNTWDEKIASCAAPQENLPAIGCPSWVMRDENE